MSSPFNSDVERFDFEQSNDQLQAALHQQRYDFVLARLRSDDSVLEVGTGTGFFSQMALRTCKEFTGLEHDAAACERTRSRLQGRATVYHGDAQAMPFASCRFSAVVCLEVLEHLDSYRMALAEIHRCLKPEGRVMISVPYRRHGGPNPLNRFHIYEPGERELAGAVRQYFSSVETYYQYFEESTRMTLARVLHLRSLTGLASVYRDLTLGTRQMTARLRIAAKPAGLKIGLLLLASGPRHPPFAR